MHVYMRPAKKSTTPTRFEHSKRWGPIHPLNVKATASDPRRASGEYLAKNHLDARGRAKLAADLIEGRAVLGKLTAKQITDICRSNAPYVAAARKSPAVAEKLAKTLAAATPKEIARELGSHKLWEILEYATAS
jgi:uncharacterized protein YciW